MTCEVSKSILVVHPNFDELVQNYAEELSTHERHMALVAEHAQSLTPIPPDQKAHPYPPPQAALPEIVNCVRKTKVGYVPDYVLVDRLRVVPGTLEARKAELLSEVATAENKVIMSLLPAGKWRAHNLRHKDIVDADAARHVEMQKSRGEKDPVVTREEVIAARRPDDHAFATEHEARHAQAHAIYRHASALMSDIEDLTEENLHEWKMAPFPEAK